MILSKITITNYKNIAEADIELSPKINCFIGDNGEGKTNFLDTLHFLSFGKSMGNHIDSQLIRHGEDFFMLDAAFTNDAGDSEMVYCGLKKGSHKVMRRNKKAYKKISEHIGLIPLIMISPADTSLIEGVSEERRRLIDMVVSQFDKNYIDHLTRYNKALQQRNSLLKADAEPDETLLDLLEQEMGRQGEAIYEKRKAFVDNIKPIFQEIYSEIALDGESVSIDYESHCQRGRLYDVIRCDRAKDRIMGYSLHGIHRDDLTFLLDGFQMKKEGSQGQRKTFVVALKLALFFALKQRNHFGDGEAKSEMPILLLDDVFDKLDARRVEQIIKIVSGERFGQIFITDTNREHLDKILKRGSIGYKLFGVSKGIISEKEDRDV